MQITPANMALLNQGFKASFDGVFKSTTPTYQSVAMTVPSSTSEEVYAWLGSNTKFREWLGDRQYQALKRHGYKIKNKTFENTVEVEREVIEDDQYGTFKPLFQQLGQDAKLHPDELIWKLLVDGFTNMCYDGQYFFDTDHPVGVGSQQASVSNFQGGSGTAWYLLDTRKIIKPLIFQSRRAYEFVAKDKLTDENVFDRNKFSYGVDGRCNGGYGMWQFAYASKNTLDDTAFASARADMGSFKTDGGKPLNVLPNLLVVPPSLEKTALEVVKATRKANGADNVMAGTAEVMVVPWLA